MISACPCDHFKHPGDLNIHAGMDHLPRQIAGFDEYRKAMLSSLGSTDPFRSWTSDQGNSDFLQMFVEWWAYISDVISFYDETIAHESYLRTARLKASLHKLVNLIGYVPNPAVAALARLAVSAEGHKSLSLPSGTAFRSGAFNGESPQVFELDRNFIIHPLTNHWTVTAPRPATIQITDKGTKSLLLEKKTADLNPGDVLLISTGKTYANLHAARIDEAGALTGEDEREYYRIRFENSLSIPNDTRLDEIRIVKPALRAYLWSKTSFADGSNGNHTVHLDGVYKDIRPGDPILLTWKESFEANKVTNINEVVLSMGSAADTYGNANADNVAPAFPYSPPPAQIPVTRLTLQKQPPSVENPSEITVLFGSVRCGPVTAEPVRYLKSAKELSLQGPVEEPVGISGPGNFILEDNTRTSVEVAGYVNFEKKTLHVNEPGEWDPLLELPLAVFGNIILASRGETVANEVVGSGDASIPNQSFKLKKKPLTYVHAPTANNERGAKSTLKIHVNGILWQEVPNFFLAGPEEQIYMVRHNEKEEAIITFGDGIRGSRVPSGTGNILANFRFGAGAASPPADMITQMAKPVKSVKSIRNPIPAYGGDDAEAEETLRTSAPHSALLLGRIVSIQDMKALAAGYPGVKAVNAEWSWHESKQQAVACIWYVGEEGIEADLERTLRDLSDPSTPIAVRQAKKISADLSIDVDVDKRFVEDEVLDVVEFKLLDDKQGILAPEHIGIGRPLYRALIFNAVTDIQGALTVIDIKWNGSFMKEYAISPGPGCFFDLTRGLTLNGQERCRE